MNDDILYCVETELQRARNKFPGPNKNFTALVEEVGELAQALNTYTNIIKTINDCLATTVCQNIRV